MSPLQIPGAQNAARRIARGHTEPSSNGISIPDEYNTPDAGSPPNATSPNREDPRSSDSNSSSASDPNEPQDFTREDTEWQDVDAEQDGDDVTYISLFDNERFSRLEDMLDYCAGKHGVDIRQTVRRLGLDFYGAIKLVNYIRSEVAQGTTHPRLDATDHFEHDRYLQPVLKDDAVLFSLDELVDSEEAGQSEPASNDTTNDDHPPADSSEQKIKDLQHQLQTLSRQFTDYKAAVEQTLEDRWSSGPSQPPTTGSSQNGRAPASARDRATRLAPTDDEPLNERDDDTHYFDSYGYNDIHDTMLRDTVRTHSYRDFIYNSKHLFLNKTVLDIGTGTGILAMFAAKAGARHVYAVDNSSVIEKARKVVGDNGLSDKITCMRGRVEDVTLPEPASSSKVTGGDSAATADLKGKRKDNAGAATGKVDIILSEWMGYALLYESMLDSVISARDRLLTSSSPGEPQGLIVPSNVTLRIAPLSSGDLISDTTGFWDFVYGFDMRGMKGGIYDDVLIRSVSPEVIVGAPATFREIDLYTVRREELEFRNAGFACEVGAGGGEEGLSGFVVWWDAFFSTERGLERGRLPKGAVAGEAGNWPGRNNEDKGLGFTTGPWGQETHWKSVVCLVDHATKRKLVDGSVSKEEKVAGPSLRKGQTVKGSVGYKRRENNSRELEIEIAWEVVGGEAEGDGAGGAREREFGRQSWLMR